MKKIVFVSLLFLVSCSSSKVSFDYDKKLNFTQFKSYNYYPELNTGMNGLDDKRLIHQLDSVLQSKGLEKTDTPELYINIKTTRFEDENPFSLNFGIGSAGRRGGVGVSGGAPVGSNVLSEVLFFDLIDVNREELIWQARSEKRIPSETTPLKRELYFAKIVTKVFQNFPPEQ